MTAICGIDNYAKRHGISIAESASGYLVFCKNTKTEYKCDSVVELINLVSELASASPKMSFAEFSDMQKVSC